MAEKTVSSGTATIRTSSAAEIALSTRDGGLARTAAGLGDTSCRRFERFLIEQPGGHSTPQPIDKREREPMPRTTGITAMALLAGVAFAGATAHAESASIGSPVVLDSMALDSVTAGLVEANFDGSAAAAGLGSVKATVDFIAEGRNNQWTSGAYAVGSSYAEGEQVGAMAIVTPVGDITYAFNGGQRFGGNGRLREFRWAFGLAADRPDVQFPVLD